MEMAKPQISLPVRRVNKREESGALPSKVSPSSPRHTNESRVSLCYCYHQAAFHVNLNLIEQEAIPWFAQAGDPAGTCGCGLRWQLSLPNVLCILSRLAVV